MWAGKKASYNSLTIEILLHFNVILMSYRFECGLYSSVASAQLRFHPKKTQDRLIRLLVIVRLKWSEQGRMFLNQMRGLRQNRKKGQKSTPPQENQLFYTISYLSLYADAEFTTIWSQFPGRITWKKVTQVKTPTGPSLTALDMPGTGKGSVLPHFVAIIISMQNSSSIIVLGLFS